MAITYSISDLAQEFDLTTRAIRFYEDLGLLQRLGLSLTEAKDIIDMYDSPRDTGPQLEKFLLILADHQKQLQDQMLDLQANLDELKVHQREAKALLAKSIAANNEPKAPKKDAA